MNLMPLLNQLQAMGLGQAAKTLYVDMLPAGATNAMLLRNPLSGTPINYELPGYYMTEFQLIVRGPAADPQTRTRIAQAVAALTFDNQQLEDHFFKYCRPRTEPVVFPISTGNLLEFSVMFDCCFVKG